MKVITIVVAIGLLTGCANAPKEGYGTAIGAVAGAVIGKQMGGEKGMYIGALLGAGIGNRIGAYLDEEDRKKVAALERKALETGTGGSFVSTKSKAVVTVAAAPATIEKPRGYALPPTAQPVPIVLVDPITIRAYVDTPVYNSTDETQAPALTIQQGVPMQISAKVANANWAVVGDNRVGLGYVPKRYLEASVVSEAKPIIEPPAAVPAAGSTTTAAVKRPTAPPPVPRVATAPKPLTQQEYEQRMAELNAAYKPRAGVNAGAPAGTTAPAAGGSGAVTVATASSECKVVSRKVAPPGGAAPVSEDIKYCNEPPKGWQVASA